MRKAIFILLGALVAAEALAQIGFFAIHGQIWSPAALRDANKAVLDTPRQGHPSGHPATTPKDGLVSHPYLGYTRSDPAAMDRNLNHYGKKRAPDDKALRVVVLGGETASRLVGNGALAAAINRNLATQAPGTTVSLIDLTLAGYKQPQPLFATAYLAAQGLEFDLILFVSTPRDLLVPALRNWERGINPLFPAGWASFVERRRGRIPPFQAAAIAVADEDLRRAVSRQRDSILYRSALVGQFLSWRVQRLRNRLADLRRGLADRPRAYRIETIGPPFAGTGHDAAIETVAVWARGARMSAEIARQQKARFLLFALPIATTAPDSLKAATLAAYRAGLGAYAKERGRLQGDGIKTVAPPPAAIGWNGPPGECCALTEERISTLRAFAARLVVGKLRPSSESTK